MKRIITIIPLILLSFLSIGQHNNVISIKRSNSFPNKEKTVSNPSQLFAKPELGLKIWTNTPLSISIYNEAEIEWQKYINEKVDDLIKTYSPVSDEHFYTNNNLKLPVTQRNIDNEPITPYTWKWVDLEKEDNRDKIVVKLRRPNWWITSNKADKVGNFVYLDLAEQGISGKFIVKKIRVNQLDTRLLQQDREGEYTFRPITGWIQHESTNIWNYTFNNGETIGSTPNHPFFSETRKKYIPIGEIEIGEAIRNPQNEIITLSSKKQRLKGREKVYNLEVYRDHNFLVGKSGLLVHNSYFIALLEDIKKWVHTEFNSQSLQKIKAIEKRLLENDPWVWQEPIFITFINQNTYLLDGHHRIQAALNINFTGEIPYTVIPISEIAKFRGGLYKTPQDVIYASK